MSDTKTVRKADEIKADIGNWAKRGVKWTKDGQALGIEVLGHIEAHGDVTLADSLVNGCPKGTKRNAMAEWLIAFGKVKLLDKAEGTRVFAYDKSRKTDIAEATKKPWYEFQPDKPLSELFDAQAATLAALKKIIGQAGKATKVEHREVLEQVEALYKTLTEVDEEKEKDKEFVHNAGLPAEGRGQGGRHHLDQEGGA